MVSKSKFTATIMFQAALALTLQGGIDQVYRMMWFHSQCLFDTAVVCHPQDWWFNISGELQKEELKKAIAGSSCMNFDNYQK